MAKAQKSLVQESPAASLGSILRKRREKRGLSIPEVALYLKIRPAQLESLEKDQFEALPGYAYLIGFIKGYARLLGLKMEELPLPGPGGRKLDHAASAPVAFPAFTFPGDTKKKKMPVSAVAVASLITIVAGYGGWRHFQPAPIPQTAVPLEQEEEPAPAEPAPAAALPDSAAMVRVPSPPLSDPASDSEPEKAPAPVSEQPQEEESASSSEPAAESPLPLKEAEPPVEEPEKTVASEAVSSNQEQEKVADADQEPVAPAPASAAEGTSLVIRAQGMSWLGIKTAKGQLLVSKVLQPGDTFTLHEKKGTAYLLSVGNAAAIELEAENVVSAPLGKSGTIRRNVPISSQLVQEGAFGRQAPPEASVSSGGVAMPEKTVENQDLPLEQEKGKNG